MNIETALLTTIAAQGSTLLIIGISVRKRLVDFSSTINRMETVLDFLLNSDLASCMKNGSTLYCESTGKTSQLIDKVDAGGSDDGSFEGRGPVDAPGLRNTQGFGALNETIK